MPKKMGRTQTRKLVRKLVAAGDVDGLVRWARDEPNAAAMLTTRIFDLDENRRWWATVALGRVAGQMAEAGETEAVREQIRRIIWLMNDESGGIAWHGAEAIAEILANVPELVSEYGRIVASLIDEEPFGPGVHWAIARIVEIEPWQFRHVVTKLAESLDSDDPWLRGHALQALAVLKPDKTLDRARELLGDPAEIPVYDSESASISSTTVGAIAQQVVDTAPEREEKRQRRLRKSRRGFVELPSF